MTIISADIEWRVVRALFPDSQPHPSPYGEWFIVEYNIGQHKELVLFFHGGWGKIAAAASTQYVIDQCSPVLLVNLGTCGGFEGKIEKGTIILAEKTIVYDLVEMMGDANEAIAHYTTAIDLSWLGNSYPHEVYRTLLVSGDRDLQREEIPHLASQFGAVVGDWESGAIAWVAARHNTKCLILRGVTDLVGDSGGEAYGNIDVFIEGIHSALKTLVNALPAWISNCRLAS